MDLESELRDALLYRLSQSGIEVLDEVEDGQRAMDEANSPTKRQAKKGLLDTAPLIHRGRLTGRHIKQPRYKNTNRF